MTSKICQKCEKIFDVIAFSAQATSKDGYNAWCKGCHRQYSRAKYMGKQPSTTNAAPRPLSRRGRPRKPDPQPR